MIIITKSYVYPCAQYHKTSKKRPTGRFFEVQTFAGSRDRAKRIVDNWNKNANSIYPKILNILLDDKK